MISSVERHRTFTDFRREGIRLRHGVVRLNHLPLERLGVGASSPQLAFAIGRRFGKAVDRNRGRRRLRAAFAEVWCRSSPDRRTDLAGAYLASATPGVLSAPYTRLVADVEACFDQLSAGPARTGDDR